MNEKTNRPNSDEPLNPSKIVTPAYAVPAVIERRTYIRAPRGMSTSAVIALLLGVLAIGLLAFYFITQKSETEHEQELQQAQARETAAINKPAPAPVIVQQPAPQQPVVIQQPAASQPVVIEKSAPPIIINQPANTTTQETEDSNIQTEVEKKLKKDPALSALEISAIVTNGKVTLIGSVTTPELKKRIERVVQDVKGVRLVDNQITVFNS